MRNVFFYLFILFGIFLSSCAAKKNESTKIVEVSSDTISYALPSENNFIITNLCDSLNSPVEVIKTIDTGVSETSLEVKDNTLVLQVKTDTVFKDRIQFKDRLVEVDKEVIKYKIPMWVWLSYIGIFVVVTAFIRFRKWL